MAGLQPEINNYSTASSHRDSYCTHFNVHAWRAFGIHQAYENKLYHINHIHPFSLSLCWPSLVPSSTLSSMLSCLAQLSFLLSAAASPLIYPFTLACICIKWGIRSSPDERSSASPVLIRICLNRFYAALLWHVGKVQALWLSVLWTLAVANIMIWSSYYTSTINFNKLHVHISDINKDGQDHFLPFILFSNLKTKPHITILMFRIKRLCCINYQSNYFTLRPGVIIQLKWQSKFERKKNKF